MAESQQSEEFVIHGILSEFSARGKIKIEDLRSLVQDNLQVNIYCIQMQPIYALIIQILKDEMGVQIVDKVKLEIQKIFDCFETLTFTREVPRFLNGRLTLQNVKIIKTSIQLFHMGLLSVKDIKDACLIFQLREMELMTEGVPCDIATLNNLLWPINKALSQQVMEEWIKRCEPFFQIKNFLQTHEFLFLVANSLDRTAYFNRIPKATMDLTRDPKFNLYNVDTTGFKTLKNPDSLIQNYMNYQFNIQKAQFKGRQLKDRNEHYKQQRQLKHNQFMNKPNPNHDDLKRVLRDPELHVEIKQRLKHAQQIINHAKLNGKMLRVQLMEEFQEKSLKNRPVSSIISTIRNENEEHKKMVQDSDFVTQYMQRVQSAKTVDTVPKVTRKVQSQFDLHSIKRPQTAQQPQRQTQRVMSANRSNMLNIIDNELTNYETLNDDSKTETKFVFYGSSNSSKRLYNINVPWHN